MTFSMFVHYLLAFFDTTKDIIIGSFGGVVAYMYDYTRHKKEGVVVVWSNSAMAINMVLGGFTANAMGSFIPMSTTGRDGLIGFIGVTSYAILSIVESRFAKAIISRMFGGIDDKV